MKVRVVRMTKRAILRNQAEDLVRKVLTETFGQKPDSKTIADAAVKVARAVPVLRRSPSHENKL
jgi:hypothetical protein